MAAGSIIFELLMRSGSFVTDTGRAAKALKQLRKESEDTARAIKASFAGNLLADLAQQFGSAFAKLPKQIIDGLDALNDLSDATGASVENLSALENVANRNGQTLEDVGGILVKFNNSLKETDGKNGVSQALKQIGLDARELQKLDPAEALRQTARALATFAADGDRARLVQEFFGKSVKDAGPFLKDLAASGALNAKVTSDQAQAAEDFNKAIFQLQTSSRDAARAIAGDLLPVINDLIKSFLKARETGESMLDAILGNTVQQRVAGNARTLSADIERATDSVVRMQTEFDRGGGTDSRLGLRIAKAKDRLFELQKQAQAATGALKGLADTRDPFSDPANFSNEGRTRSAPSVGALKTAPKVQKAKEGKDPDEQVKAFIEHQKELAKAALEAAQAQETFFQTQQKVLEGFEDERKAAQELANTFGITRDELFALNQEKLRAQAASLELLAINKGDKENNEELARLYRQQAEAIRATANAKDLLNQKESRLRNDPLAGASQGVKDYLDEISRAGEETRRITDGALHGLEDVLSSNDPRQAAKRLVSGLLAEFYRLLLIKPLMASILGNGGSGLQSILSLFSRGFNTFGGTTVSPQLVGEFASGTPYVPRTGLALVHEGEKITPRGQNTGATVIVNNVPAGYGFDAQDDGNGNTTLTMRDVARAEIARASRPGGQLRRTLRRSAPDRA